MGLFGNNIDLSEQKQIIRQEIFEGKYVEIAIPTINSISDNILAAKELTLFGNRPKFAADGGVSTTWNITSLTIGNQACAIELGGMLIPYFLIKSIMKHPFKDMRYSFILVNNEIINFSFRDELQMEVALEIFKEKGLNIVE